MDWERYKLILREMHEARMKALQSAHDSLLYEVRRLKQRQQSGTQQHLVVSEKRQLALLIGKNERARKQLIRQMASHVKYMVDNTENQNIPTNWKTMAMQGAPHWCEAVEEFAVTPSTAEKNSIVESYLKRQRAWEQVTEILPRETVDAMRFFGDLERRSMAIMECLPSSQPDGQPTSREMREYHLGCLTLCQDLCVRARECCLRCRDVWNRIENELQSSKIVDVTMISNEAGQVPAYLKVNAMLPLLPVTRQPSVELLNDYIGEYDSFQERVALHAGDVQRIESV